MKRSKAIELIFKRLGPAGISEPTCEEVLEILERNGIEPPKVKSKIIKGKDYPYGGGCTMRCNCEDCNPNFLINAWEPEDNS